MGLHEVENIVEETLQISGPEGIYTENTVRCNQCCILLRYYARENCNISISNVEAKHNSEGSTFHVLPCVHECQYKIS